MHRLVLPQRLGGDVLGQVEGVKGLAHGLYVVSSDRLERCLRLADTATQEEEGLDVNA